MLEIKLNKNYKRLGKYINSDLLLRKLKFILKKFWMFAICIMFPPIFYYFVLSVSISQYNQVFFIDLQKELMGIIKFEINSKSLIESFRSVYEYIVVSSIYMSCSILLIVYSISIMFRYNALDFGSNQQERLFYFRIAMLAFGIIFAGVNILILSGTNPVSLFLFDEVVKEFKSQYPIQGELVAELRALSRLPVWGGIAAASLTGLAIAIISIPMSGNDCMQGAKIKRKRDHQNNILIIAVFHYCLNVIALRIFLTYSSNFMDKDSSELLRPFIDSLLLYWTCGSTIILTTFVVVSYLSTKRDVELAVKLHSRDDKFDKQKWLSANGINIELSGAYSQYAYTLAPLVINFVYENSILSNFISN